MFHFWTAQTIKERRERIEKAQKRLKSNPNCFISLTEIQSQIDLKRVKKEYWLAQFYSFSWQLVAFVIIPLYFYLYRRDWSPEPYQLLDFTQLNQIVDYYLYVVLVYVGITFGRTASAHMIAYLFDIPFQIPMHSPWMAVSLKDFWSVRWNRTVQRSLKRIGFEPIVKSNLFSNTTINAIVGILMTFFLSAIMHEWYLFVVLILFY
jgi:hypothetical protein